MAAGFNRVSLIGNLGRDPELRYTPSGTAVCSLRLGVTERRKEGDSWNNHTEWFTVICFGKTAENADKYIKKGRSVFVEGRLQTRSWDDQNGQKRYITEVVANQLLFLGSRESGADSSYSSDNSSFEENPASSSNDTNSSGKDIFQDDDLPF